LQEKVPREENRTGDREKADPDAARDRRDENGRKKGEERDAFDQPAMRLPAYPAGERDRAKGDAIGDGRPSPRHQKNRQREPHP
jgi:hypothetical protein